MFDKNFYPTPSDVARQMLSNCSHLFDRVGIAILEPSSGKGDLLNAIISKLKFRDSYGWMRNNRIYAIEKNPELHLLSSQIEGVSMLGYDFLSYNGGIYFDLIVMNPPFDKAEAHLLHAWNLLDNGEIVCLLNEESIDNPYSEDRKKLKHLIEQEGGRVQYLGACFKGAERRTNVNVVCVHFMKGTVHIEFLDEDVWAKFNQISAKGKNWIG